MRILLYDREPRSHYLDVTKLESLGLQWHKPGDELPDLKQFGAVLIHVTDAKDFKQDICIRVVQNEVLLIVFSGDAGIASEEEMALKSQHPAARICSISVRDLYGNIEAALTKQDLEELCWDRLSDVLELLSTIWALGLHWETQGQPSVISNSDNTFSFGVSEQSLIDSSGKLSVSKIGAIRASNAHRLSAIATRIYRRNPRPDTNFQVLAVSNPSEYHLCVATLRDSLLAWVQNANRSSGSK